MCRLEYVSGEHNGEGVDNRIQDVPQHEYRKLTADLFTVGTSATTNGSLCRYQGSLNQFIIEHASCKTNASELDSKARNDHAELKEHLEYLTTGANISCHGLPESAGAGAGINVCGMCSLQRLRMTAD